MDLKELDKILTNIKGVWLDYPFGKNTAVYKVGQGDKAKMFALVDEHSEPLRLSLKCDPVLAETLREQYESVLPGYHLNKRHWNTLILSGQLSEQEIRDLIRHSYDLVAQKNN